LAIYALKPSFQALLRPLVVRLYSAGAMAIQVALAACALPPIIGVTMIEGHDGTLDRLDSVCFAVPIYFYVVSCLCVCMA